MKRLSRLAALLLTLAMLLSLVSIAHAEESSPPPRGCCTCVEP